MASVAADRNVDARNTVRAEPAIQNAVAIHAGYHELSQRGRRRRRRDQVETFSVALAGERTRPKGAAPKHRDGPSVRSEAGVGRAGFIQPQETQCSHTAGVATSTDRPAAVIEHAVVAPVVGVLREIRRDNAPVAEISVEVAKFIEACGQKTIHAGDLRCVRESAQPDAVATVTLHSPKQHSRSACGIANRDYDSARCAKIRVRDTRGEEARDSPEVRAALSAVWRFAASSEQDSSLGIRGHSDRGHSGKLKIAEVDCRNTPIAKFRIQRAVAMQAHDRKSAEVSRYENVAARQWQYRKNKRHRLTYGDGTEPTVAERRIGCPIGKETPDSSLIQRQVLAKCPTCASDDYLAVVLNRNGQRLRAGVGRREHDAPVRAESCVHVAVCCMTRDRKCSQHDGQRFPVHGLFLRPIIGHKVHLQRRLLNQCQAGLAAVIPATAP